MAHLPLRLCWLRRSAAQEERTHTHYREMNQSEIIQSSGGIRLREVRGVVLLQNIQEVHSCIYMPLLYVYILIIIFQMWW